MGGVTKSARIPKDPSVVSVALVSTYIRMGASAYHGGIHMESSNYIIITT